MFDFKNFSVDLKRKTIGDYHNLYLKTDVLSLVEQNIMNIRILEYYGLDPCHYFKSPRSSWNSMFKMTEIELELISNKVCIYLLKKE